MAATSTPIALLTLMSSDTATPSLVVSSQVPSASHNRPATRVKNLKLIEYIKRSVKEDEDFYFLRFESLQRINITALHLKLLKLKEKIKTENGISSNDLEILRKTLKHHATAIRDYNFLRTRKALKPKNLVRKPLLQSHFQNSFTDLDVFNSHYSSFEEATSKPDFLRQAFMKYFPTWLSYSRNERMERPQEYATGKPPREVSSFIDWLVRFTISAVGGLFLIGPMLIMAISPSLNKSLITVSAAVSLFIILLSFGVRVTNVEALVSTATYAAVLVVFVGTSTGGGEVAGLTGNSKLM